MNYDTMLKALQEILNEASDHPAFDRSAFESRDIDSLVKQGGDICDWTMIAIIAADALSNNEQDVRPQNESGEL
jgi:hypothetical protein